MLPPSFSPSYPSTCHYLFVFYAMTPLVSCRVLSGWAERVRGRKRHPSWLLLVASTAQIECPGVQTPLHCINLLYHNCSQHSYPLALIWLQLLDALPTRLSQLFLSLYCLCRPVDALPRNCKCNGTHSLCRVSESIETIALHCIALQNTALLPASMNMCISKMPSEQL